MRRASKLCSDPECPNPQPCPKHSAPAWTGSTRRQRLPPGWEKLRQSILIRDPVCCICGQATSAEVDHIEAGDDHRPSNLQGVCTPCHRRKSSAEGNAARGGG